MTKTLVFAANEGNKTKTAAEFGLVSMTDLSLDFILSLSVQNLFEL